MVFSGWGEGGEFVFLANTGVGDVIQSLRAINYPITFPSTFTRMIVRSADAITSGSFDVELLKNGVVVTGVTFTGPLPANTTLGVGFTETWVMNDNMDVRISTPDTTDPNQCGFSAVIG